MLKMVTNYKAWAMHKLFKKNLHQSLYSTHRICAFSLICTEHKSLSDGVHRMGLDKLRGKNQCWLAGGTFHEILHSKDWAWSFGYQNF